MQSQYSEKEADPLASSKSGARPYLEERHRLAVRWMHWVNFPLLMIMIWSGLMIYWAFPVYRIGFLRFFPDWFYSALHLNQRLADGMALAGGMALATQHDVSLTGSHTDCCPNSKPCEQKTDDCDSLAGCLLKCCGFLASLPAPIKVALPAFASEKPAHALRSFRSPAENPPLPPPRV